MAKKSFWQGLKDFFKDEETHIITDEEWEAMQAEEAAKAAEAGESGGPLEIEDGWRCPECYKRNGPERLFCERCGYRPGGFEDVLADMSSEHIQIVLKGSIRYPAQQLQLLENELARRKAGQGAVAFAARPEGWKCTRCGAVNPEEEYHCTACGEYRY